MHTSSMMLLNPYVLYSQGLRAYKTATDAQLRQAYVGLRYTEHNAHLYVIVVAHKSLHILRWRHSIQHGPQAKKAPDDKELWVRKAAISNAPVEETFASHPNTRAQAQQSYITKVRLWRFEEWLLCSPCAVQAMAHSCGASPITMQ